MFSYSEHSLEDQNIQTIQIENMNVTESILNILISSTYSYSNLQYQMVNLHSKSVNLQQSSNLDSHPGSRHGKGHKHFKSCI